MAAPFLSGEITTAVAWAATPPGHPTLTIGAAQRGEHAGTACTTGGGSPPMSTGRRSSSPAFGSMTRGLQGPAAVAGGSSGCTQRLRPTGFSF